MVSIMKKTAAFFVSFVLMLSLIACGNMKNGFQGNKDKQKETEVSGNSEKSKETDNVQTETGNTQAEEKDYPENYLLSAEIITETRSEKRKTEYYYNVDGTIAQKRCYEGSSDRETDETDGEEADKKEADEKDIDWEETERYEYFYWNETKSEYCYKIEEGNFILSTSRDYMYEV